MIESGTLLGGRYRILRMLGDGAMGEVFEADDPESGRRVAIKVIHAHFVKDAVMVRRFEGEARAAAEIGHPGFVAVHDAGSHDGQPFLVMEMLLGRTLAARLGDAGRIDPAEACRITGRMLSALAAAHAKGIIHRDLKPENIFLCDGAGDGAASVRVLDFGISKFRGRARAADSTQEGMRMGTPRYMPPEQWMGRRDFDHRADLFSCGVLLYEMLTGTYPYRGKAEGELLLEVVRGTSVPAAPSTLNPAVPAELDAVVLRAVERDRAKRFPSARAFLDAIKPFGADGIDAEAAVAEAPESGAFEVAPGQVFRPKKKPPRKLPPPEVFVTVAIVLTVIALGCWMALR